MKQHITMPKIKINFELNEELLDRNEELIEAYRKIFMGMLQRIAIKIDKEIMSKK